MPCRRHFQLNCRSGAESDWPAKIMEQLRLIAANGAAPYGAPGNTYLWWGGWWWLWAVIVFFFLVIIFGAAGNHGGYYRRGAKGRTTPIGGSSGEPVRPMPLDDAGADWGLAWLWLLIIFIICLAFFGGGHWWQGGH